MTFREKIAVAFQARTYDPRRLWASAGAGAEKRREAERKRLAAEAKKRRTLLAAKLRGQIDLPGLEALRALGEAKDRPDVFWTKYLDVDRWLGVNIKHAEDLGLLDKPVADVLDLGCGAGYFLLVCRSLGARTLGLDVDWDQVLNGMIQLFGLERVALAIQPQVRLPDFGRQFDLITGFMVCFNFPTLETYWSVQDWDFFLNDLLAYLRPGGRVYFCLNKQPDGEHYTPAIKEYFLSRGAVVNGKRVLFNDIDLRRTRSESPALTAA